MSALNAGAEGRQSSAKRMDEASLRRGEGSGSARANSQSGLTSGSCSSRSTWLSACLNWRLPTPD
jgi:hypothetical protein